MRWLPGVHVKASAAARPRVLLALRDGWAVESAGPLEEAASPGLLGRSRQETGAGTRRTCCAQATEGRRKLSLRFLASVVAAAEYKPSLLPFFVCPPVAEPQRAAVEVNCQR